MKLVTLAFLMLLSIAASSQKTVTAYIELRGTADALGNMYIDPIIKPKKLENKIDSLINYKDVNSNFRGQV